MLGTLCWWLCCPCIRAALIHIEITVKIVLQIAGNARCGLSCKLRRRRACLRRTAAGVKVWQVIRVLWIVVLVFLTGGEERINLRIDCCRRRIVVDLLNRRCIACRYRLQ